MSPTCSCCPATGPYASARGTYTGSGVEHSMVNQLLTEMDGFSSREGVIVLAARVLISPREAER